MRLLFAGTPDIAIPSLHALLASGHDIVGVITREDAPLGRKRQLTPSPVAQAASDLGLDLCKTNRLDEAATAWARERAADLGVVVAYGGLLREPLLSLPRLGWVNLHFSELPRWRGAAPVQRALMAGEQRLGVTVFRLVPELDAGSVLSRDAVTVAPGTSAGEALRTLADFGTGALCEALALLERDPAAGEEQQGEPSYAPKLTREDAHLDLTQASAAVLAQWAGVTPEPGAFVWCEAQPLKILELRHCEPGVATGSAGVEQSAPTVRLHGGRAILVLNDGELELLRVQPAGKAAMSAADWLRGRGGSAVLQ